MSTPLSQVRGRVPRLADAAVERARLTVVPRRTQKAARVPFVTLVSLLLVGGIAGLLLFNTSMQHGSFVATSMEEQAAVLEGTEETLRIQLHKLRDPQHVAAEAKRLGMVPASNPAFLRLSDGKVLGRPAPAEPADAVRIAPLPPVKPASLRPKLVILEVPKARRDQASARSQERRRDEGRRQDRAGARRDTDRASAAGSREQGSERRTKRQERTEDRSGRTP